MQGGCIDRPPILVVVVLIAPRLMEVLVGSVVGLGMIGPILSHSDGISSLLLLELSSLPSHFCLVIRVFACVAVCCCMHVISTGCVLLQQSEPSGWWLFSLGFCGFSALCLNLF